MGLDKSVVSDFPALSIHVSATVEHIVFQVRTYKCAVTPGWGALRGARGLAGGVHSPKEGEKSDGRMGLV